MDPFDWTKDKSIYQKWQLWSEKARLTPDAMEGDSEKTKISYFHHWINGEGMGHTESWKTAGMEGNCMRCGKPEHQPGQKCAAKNAKCKECHKIGHFYNVYQSKRRGRSANLAQIAPQSEQDTHINENGVRQPNPPMVNMLKIVNHIGATRGSQEKYLKFPSDVDPKRTLQAPSSGKS